MTKRKVKYIAGWALFLWGLLSIFAIGARSQPAPVFYSEAERWGHITGLILPFVLMAIGARFVMAERALRKAAKG
jgi:hypothetical protein